MSCNCSNPCGESCANTAACESLSSQVANFTLQFFGTVVKTEVDGVVSWSLPCSLDVGLENNPRAVDEGLACYFLRLFQDGIIGATGPQGDTGADGDDGRNAYTVLLSGFTQPSLGSPNIQISSSFNPAIVEGLYVFIQASGWYLVTQTDLSGSLWLTLTKALPGAGATISAGKLIVPSGYPGASVTGATGPAGPQGVPGDAGASFTETHGMYFTAAGTNYNLTVTYTAVNFTASSPAVLLPEVGTYLITAVIDAKDIGAIATTDQVSFKLRDTSDSADLDGSEHIVSNFVVDKKDQVVINVIYATSGVNKTVAIFGKCTTGAVIATLANYTTLTYVRIA